MLSKKTQYAFKSLTYLAENDQKGPVLIADIASKKKIPIKFLESILLELKKAGILGAKKGKGGGYYFVQKPDQVKLATIMRLMEGPIALLPCVSLHFYHKCTDCNEKKCGLNKTMAAVRDQMLTILEHKSVLDLVVQ
ncbi:MAG: Rrf2 family transcriptional regulator [Sphingobacteriia bacterium]|jgi:Rrf2 family protein|nr:MAG: Rrf2 family transcriptional regulator [Sphingobacteriia bacterium]